MTCHAASFCVVRGSLVMRDMRYRIIAGMPLLGLLLPRPLAGRAFDHIEDVVGDVARARVSHRAAPRCRPG